MPKDPAQYIYTENGSKNRSGELRIENKTVPIMANVELGIQCHVHLLDVYISKLPKRLMKLIVFTCNRWEIMLLIIHASLGSHLNHVARIN